jgi:hypothetical protein
MKATTLYRIAAIILLLFAVGHTFGFLSFRPHSPEGVAVFESMNRVHFQEGRYSFSFGNFYRGFGLSISVSMLFSAFLSWHLGWMARNAPAAIGALGWLFAVVQVAGIVIGWVYFSPVQAGFAAAVAICLAWAAAVVPAAPRG